MDLAGPIRTRSRGGAKYLLTIVDDFTRKLWVFFLFSKAQVTNQVLVWAAMMMNELGISIVTIRSDRGREFFNKAMTKWCQARGIKHELTVQENPQQNGVAERAHQTIFSLVRTYLIWSGAAHHWWAEAAAYAVHVLNRRPHAALKMGTPEYRWSGTRADASMLHTWGCVAYVRIEPTKRSKPKLSPHGKKCMFVGYSDVSKGWHFWDPATKKVELSRDAKFLDSIPFFATPSPDNLYMLEEVPLDLHRIDMDLGEMPTRDEDSDSEDEEPAVERIVEDHPSNGAHNGSASGPAPRRSGRSRSAAIFQASRAPQGL
jgi:hypothetical protein